jgi:hypothetical protein
MERKVRVRSSFVRSENAANDAANLKRRKKKKPNIRSARSRMGEPPDTKKGGSKWITIRTDDAKEYRQKKKKKIAEEIGTHGG